MRRFLAAVRLAPAHVVCQEKEYVPPPRCTSLDSPDSEPARMAVDAVRRLDAMSLRKVLNEHPRMAALSDATGETLFHVFAVADGAETERNEVLNLLLAKGGWDVVDAKNARGFRADASGPGSALLKSRSRKAREPLRVDKALTLTTESSDCPWRWTSCVDDEQRRCWAAVLRQSAPEPVLDRWFRAAQECEKIRPVGGEKRRAAWFTDAAHLHCPYRYSGLEFPAEPFPDWVQEIRVHLGRVCGLADEDLPNSVNVNLYANQSEEVGWHADDEVFFQGLSGDTLILSFSLGASREFCWRLQGETEKAGDVRLGHGDLMTMEGLFQRHYKHSAPGSDEPCGPRVNLTFRWIVVDQHASDAGVKSTSPVA
jgi:alkylated DNA repair dioxygenase AlkB